MVTSGEKKEESKIVISHTPTAFTEEVSNTSQDRQDFRKQTLWPCHEKPEGCLHLLFYSYFCSITALPCASAPMAHCQTPWHPQGSRNLSMWIGTPSSESRSTEPGHVPGHAHSWIAGHQWPTGTPTFWGLGCKATASSLGFWGLQRGPNMQGFNKHKKNTLLRRADLLHNAVWVLLWRTLEGWGKRENAMPLREKGHYHYFLKEKHFHSFSKK